MRIFDFGRSEQLEEELNRYRQLLNDARSKLNDARSKAEADAETSKQNFAALKRDLKIQHQRESKKILEEASTGFPWLARAITNYETLHIFRDGKHLRAKAHSAWKASEKVKFYGRQSRQFRRAYHIVRSRIDYYEELFPWIKEYVGLELDKLLEITAPQEAKKEFEEDSSDPVRRFLTQGEFEKLPPRERNQKALDRYLARRSNWQIGRDYERYIGYCYEKEGYEVEYFGIKEGYSDLGRDLILKNAESVKIVQCKCWSKYKVIHEKHIAQLFGTTVKYSIDRGLDASGVKGVFVTSTVLSKMAKAFAGALGIDVREEVPMGPYPIIKCNVGIDESGGETHIYHLPMDQQYDSTKITKNNEFYAFTVEDAENRGFRRAWRWRPGND